MSYLLFEYDNLAFEYDSLVFVFDSLAVDACYDWLRLIGKNIEKQLPSSTSERTLI